MNIETEFIKDEKTEFPFFSIKINYNKPVIWFQIVKITSEKYNVKNDKYFEKYQNRFINKNTFIDSSIDPSFNTYPFYTRGNYFEDLPNFGKQTNLKWIAKVYAVKDNKTLTYLTGYKWGFEIKNGNILLINTIKLNKTKNFEKYRLIIKNERVKYVTNSKIKTKNKTKTKIKI